MLPDVLLIRLEISPCYTSFPVCIVLRNLRSIHHWLPELIPRDDHVAFWQCLWSIWILQPSVFSHLRRVALEFILLLMVHDYLLDAAGCITVRKDTFTRLAHLKNFVCVHRAEDKLFIRDILEEYLRFDNIEHLSNLLLCKSVNEIDFVEVDQHAVLGSPRVSTSHLAFPHIHETLHDTIVLAWMYTAQAVELKLFVGALLVIILGRGHKVGSFHLDFFQEFYLAFLNDEELVEWEVLLGQDHFAFLALADHHFRGHELQVAVRNLQENVHLCQEHHHFADFLFTSFLEELVESSEFYFEEDEVVLAFASSLDAVALYVHQRVGELVIDYDGVSWEEEEGLVFQLLSFAVAIGWQYRFDQPLPKDAHDGLVRFNDLTFFEVLHYFDALV